MLARQFARRVTSARHLRCLSTSSGLKERLIDLMPEKQEALKKMKKEHGSKVVDKVCVRGAARLLCASRIGPPLRFHR